MKPFLLIFGLLLWGWGALGQSKDTVRSNRKSFENSFFFSNDTLSRNDYLLKIGKVLQVLNRATMVAPSESAVMSISLHLSEDSSILAIIRDRLSTNERAIKVRNLQMYDILLRQMHENTREYAAQLQKEDSTLDNYKKEVAEIVKDTTLRHLFRDSALRASFRPQLSDLRIKWRLADSILKKSHLTVNNTLAQTSDNLININETRLLARNIASTIGKRIFGKERRYLWQQRRAGVNPALSKRIKQGIATEKKITQYYFSINHSQKNILLFVGMIFFIWISVNFRLLKKSGSGTSIDQFSFKFINPYPIFASILLILNLAPLFDLDAPAVYIEFIGFLLMFTLTIAFFRRLPRNIFLLWVGFVLLYLFSFVGYLRLPFYMNRWISLALNGCSIVLGLYAFLKYRRIYSQKRVLKTIVWLYIVFNFIAVVCNLTGRVTLMQLFSSTANYALIQAVGLIIFVKSIVEAFILQIHKSRMLKGYNSSFDYKDIRRGITKIMIVCAALIWLVVFITNLDLYNSLSERIWRLLYKPRVIGSFSFTLGSLFLFLAIMWIANFLQKYIGYFFGDIGDEVSVDDKAHRSRLLITRLLLLVGGFLLAVAASGLPVDRITVILGALGVGIGLGLQGIVNNFVSGIILIFDRTLRIGDTVQIGDNKGRVKEISVRSSTLLTHDGAEVIIPNGDILSHNIVNWTLSNSSVRIELTISIDKMVPLENIKGWVSEFVKIQDKSIINREPEVFISNLTSQSMQLRIYLWSDDVRKSEYLKSEILKYLYRNFEENGIKII